MRKQTKLSMIGSFLTTDNATLCIHTLITEEQMSLTVRQNGNNYEEKSNTTRLTPFTK